ncbi:FAD-dependent oxidoreductase [Leptolyngbya sp. CCNP1308]|uniref:NAD(P)/FAD-dependent oxidoreductase n=1 Tax=Leptolyngbya sp. CCNP1308 TaxID=3110255 RepID=UPI002B21A70A|nr:FAD-dependent oxidoreductase [Leptolyngbya sp. CCNP1308]MEA5452229.1 FAD-dependent oxidoreductase [Leptolyngbya sp. CCNP1308]
MWQEIDMEDVVVIGAGISGLTAAHKLQKSGYRVLVVDKSRGLGGRLATRRVGSTAIDHGCRYLKPFADSALSPIPSLLQSGVLQPWRPETFALEADGSLSATSTETLYTAPKGMSAIAKALASGLSIHRHWRATALTRLPHGWQIEGEALSADSFNQPSSIEARAVVVALPAAQAAALLDKAARQNGDIERLLEQLQTVEFEPAITVMAGFSLNQSASLSIQKTSDGWMVASDTHPVLRWAALDSSKRTDPQESVVVVHSSPAFAANNIDRSDLESVGQELLAATAESLAAWIGSPTCMQIHRWRYGFVRQPLGASVLSSPVLPNFVGCGDWCLGKNVEGAIASGDRAAKLIAAALK